MPRKKTQPKRPGPPSKYSADIVDKMIEYFSVPAGEWRQEYKNGFRVRVYEPTELPLLQSFATSVGVGSTTMYGWLTAIDDEGNLRYPEFAAAYTEAKKQQERILIHNGLNGSYKTAFAIFSMKNMCGWRDAMSLEHTGKDGGPIRSIKTEMTAKEAAEAYAETLAIS